jgi:hypothetical protein
MGGVAVALRRGAEAGLSRAQRRARHRLNCRLRSPRAMPSRTSGQPSPRAARSQVSLGLALRSKDPSLRYDRSRRKPDIAGRDGGRRSQARKPVVRTLVHIGDAPASRLSSLRLLSTKLKIRARASLHDSGTRRHPGIEGAARRKCANALKSWKQRTSKKGRPKRRKLAVVGPRRRPLFAS